MVGATVAQPWSLLLGEIGKGLVWLAVVLQLVSIGIGISGESRSKLSSRFFFAGCVSLLLAFGVVISLFVADQYQYKYVFEHGAKDNELRYKIAGTWSGQEGSILLWGSMAAIFGLFSQRVTGSYQRWYTVFYAAFIGIVASILAFESPFTLSPLVDGKVMVPSTGQGLNPTLLNYWVVIHPPVIFAGFGSLTVLFSWAVSALVNRDLNTWANMIRPWAMVSLSLLGLGLAMGGFWAYETLGWGGFWMWDPVENTSFVPWVGVAAFLHGLYVQSSRQKWMITNALLAGLPFILFCYGTFLTRSGFLGDTSVHSFAEMDRKALWLLISLVGVSTFGFLSLWGARALKSTKTQDSQVYGFTRQKAMGLGIWLLVGIGVITSIGMSLPFIQSVSGHKPKVVEEPLYNTVLAFLYVPLILLMAVAPFLGWGKVHTKDFWSKLVNVFFATMGLVGFTLLWVKSDFHGLPADMTATTKLLLKYPVNRVAWVMFLSFVTMFGIVGAFFRLVEVSFVKSKEDLGRKILGPGSQVGGYLTHIGVGVAMLGLIFSRGLEQKKDAFIISNRQSVDAMSHTFQSKGPTKDFVDKNNRILIDVKGPSGTFTMTPGLYFRGMDESGQPIPFIWPAIHGAGLFDLYLVLHNINFDASGATEMKTGEQRLLKDENMLVTYQGLRSAGPLGQRGAEFFAKVKVDTPQGTFNVEPSIKLGAQGMESNPAKVGSDYAIELVSMNAADKSATLQVKYVQPTYVAELFFKPLTIFVWLGIGIMTAGGFLAAWTRRRSNKSRNEDSFVSGQVPQGFSEENATQEVAQV